MTEFTTKKKSGGPAKKQWKQLRNWKKCWCGDWEKTRTLIWCWSVLNLLTDLRAILNPVHGLKTDDHLQQINCNKVTFHFLPLLTSRCSPLSRIPLRATLFPFCSPYFVLQSRQEVCFAVCAACHHIFAAHGQQWPAGSAHYFRHHQVYVSYLQICISWTLQRTLFNNTVNSNKKLWQTSRILYQIQFEKKSCYII